MPTVLACYFLPLEHKVTSLFCFLSVSFFLPVEGRPYKIQLLQYFMSNNFCFWFPLTCLPLQSFIPLFAVSFSHFPSTNTLLLLPFQAYFLNLFSHHFDFAACVTSISFHTTLSSYVEFKTLRISSLHNIVAVSFFFFSPAKWFDLNLIFCLSDFKQWQIPHTLRSDELSCSWPNLFQSNIINVFFCCCTACVCLK